MVQPLVQKVMPKPFRQVGTRKENKTTALVRTFPSRTWKSFSRPVCEGPVLGQDNYPVSALQRIKNLLTQGSGGFLGWESGAGVGDGRSAVGPPSEFNIPKLQG